LLRVLCRYCFGHCCRLCCGYCCRHCWGIVADIVAGIVADFVAGIVADIVAGIVAGIFFTEFYSNRRGHTKYKVSLRRFSGNSYLLIGMVYRRFAPRFIQVVRRLSWTRNKDIAKHLAAFDRKVLRRIFVGIKVN